MAINAPSAAGLFTIYREEMPQRKADENPTNEGLPSACIVRIHKTRMYVAVLVFAKNRAGVYLPYYAYDSSIH